MGSFRDFWNIDESEFNVRREKASLQMSVFFNASHQVKLDSGELGNIHSHSFHLKVQAKGKVNFKNDMITPFEYLKDILNRIASIYEEKHLNSLPIFQTLTPTLENLTTIIAIQTENLSVNLPIIITEVSLFESPTVGITIISNE